MITNTTPHAMGILFKKSSMEVIQAVKGSLYDPRWDNYNKRIDWLDTIEQNLDKLVEKIDNREMFIKARKTTGGSLNGNILTINKKFLEDISPYVSLEDKADMLFKDVAGLLCMAVAEPSQPKAQASQNNTPVRKLHSA